MCARRSVECLIKVLSCRPPAVLRETHTNGVIHPPEDNGVLDPNGTVKIEESRSWGGIFTHFALCKGDISNKQRDVEVYL